MLKFFTRSITGSLFTVDYNLRIYVKHDSWNEFGQGNCINLPIKIMQPELDITSKDTISAPKDWKPFVAEPVQMILPMVKPTEPGAPGHVYYKNVLAPAMQKWDIEDNYRPSLIGAGQIEEEKKEEEKVEE